MAKPSANKKKKSSLKKYLIEFVLVFGAIVLGFFAENLREHYAEKAKEKEFIKSLVENLKADSVVFAKRDSTLNDRIRDLDSLAFLLTNNLRSKNSNAYLLARYATRIIQFSPGLSTLNFLAKSDVYSSLDDIDIKGNIQVYESNLNWLQNLIELDEEHGKSLYSFVGQIFDAKIFLALKRRGTQIQLFDLPKGNPPLFSENAGIINSFAYHLHIRKSTFYSERINIELFNKRRIKLIAFLTEKYGLSAAN